MRILWEIVNGFVQYAYTLYSNKKQYIQQQKTILYTLLTVQCWFNKTQEKDAYRFAQWLRKLYHFPLTQKQRMEHIFDRLISACRDIISQEQQQPLPSGNTTDMRQQEAEPESEAEQWGEQKWHEIENAITRHIQLKNANKTAPIILLEEQSEEHNKHQDTQETQGQCENRESESKTTLTMPNSAPEVKTSFISKTKPTVLPKKAMANSRKQEMNRDVLCRVNIQQLKQKIIYDKPKDPKPQQKQPISETKQSHQLSNIIARDTLKTIEEVSHADSEQSRGKVAKKGGKNQKPPVRTGPMDLGGCTLQQVVEHCQMRGVIGDQLYMQFMASSREESISQFIALFIQNNLKLWDFKRFKITIMDHRRLAEYLVRIYPQSYKICDPRSDDPNIRDFLQNLYGLTPLKYKKLLESLDAESKVPEWKVIRNKFQRYANVSVRIQPLPIPIHQEKAPIKKPIGQTYSQTVKTAPMLRAGEKDIKRNWSSVYEGEEDEQEMRLKSLRNQLKKRQA